MNDNQKNKGLAKQRFNELALNADELKANVVVVRILPLYQIKSILLIFQTLKLNEKKPFLFLYFLLNIAYFALYIFILLLFFACILAENVCKWNVKSNKKIL